MEALAKIPPPTDVSRLRAMLGFATYYKKLVEAFNMITNPLTILTKNNQQWEQGDSQEATFLEVKQSLTFAPIIRQLIPWRSYQLHTDWSGLGPRMTRA